MALAVALAWRVQKGAAAKNTSRKHEPDPHQIEFKIRRRGELRIASLAVQERRARRVLGTVEQALSRH